MSIHVCECKGEFHLRYPGMDEKAAQDLAGRINAGCLLTRRDAFRLKMGITIADLAKFRLRVEVNKRQAVEISLADLLDLATDFNGHQVALCVDTSKNHPNRYLWDVRP